MRSIAWLGLAALISVSCRKSAEAEERKESLPPTAIRVETAPAVRVGSPIEMAP